MGNVVGMDGQDVEAKKPKLSREDILAMRADQAKRDEQDQRFKLLEMAMKIENPGTYQTANIVATAEKLAAFVKQESKDEGHQTMAAVAPGTV